MPGRWLLAVGILLLLAGCGSPATESSLQRFDALSGAFKRVSADTRLAARAITLVNRSTRLGNASKARYEALSLHRNGLALRSAADSAARRLNRLPAAEENSYVLRYYRLLLRSLRQQAVEGAYLASLGALARSDPFLLAPPHLTRLHRLQRRLRLAEARARDAAHAAADLRHAHPRVFTYTPVRKEG